MARPSAARRLALAALLLAACRGGDGPVGPAGPQGAEGPVGPQGPVGTANVISGRDTITEADWSSTTVQWSFFSPSFGSLASASMRYADIPVPALTARVLEDGAVLAYITPDLDYDFFVAMPFNFTVSSPTYRRVLDFEPRPGVLRVLFYHAPLEGSVTPPSPLTIAQPTRIVRWVIIPPAVGLQGALTHLPDEAWVGPSARP